MGWSRTGAPRGRPPLSRTFGAGHDTADGRPPQAEAPVTRAEQERRDRLDSTRTASPLAKAAGAHEIDSTGLSLDEVIEAVVRLAKEHE